jgi:D-alanine-D-alanine ligase
MKKIAILYGQLPPDPSDDEKDVLDEVRAISKSLKFLHYHPVAVEMSLDLGATIKKLKKINPLLVFNLVEGIGSCGRWISLAPILLENENFRFTGCPADAMYVTSNKILSKKLMRLDKIPTPAWQTLDSALSDGIKIPLPFILKSV